MSYGVADDIERTGKNETVVSPAVVGHDYLDTRPSAVCNALCRTVDYRLSDNDEALKNEVALTCGYSAQICILRAARSDRNDAAAVLYGIRNIAGQTCAGIVGHTVLAAALAKRDTARQHDSGIAARNGAEIAAREIQRCVEAAVLALLAVISHRIIAIQPRIIYAEIGRAGNKHLLLSGVDIVSAEIVIYELSRAVASGRNDSELDYLGTVALKAMLTYPSVDTRSRNDSGYMYRIRRDERGARDDERIEVDYRIELVHAADERAGAVLLSLHNPITILIQASGRIRTYHLVAESIMILCLPVTWVLFRMGMPAYVAFISMIVLCGVAHVARVICLKRMQGTFSLASYFSSILLPCVLVAGGGGGVSLIIYVTMEPGVLRLGLMLLASPLVTLCLAYFVGMTSYERSMVNEIFRKFLRR